MIRKRTFIDSGVLIAAARGKDAPSIRALEILDDQSREFASSPFVELEVLPKAVYNQKRYEAEFYEAFFDSVSFWEDDLATIMRDANRVARLFGLSAMDSLHVAAAILCGSEELVTTERSSKPIHRVQGIIITSIHENP
ncbi:MAG TPA: PIN domain-containing protein [Methanothrix sp.]|nr:PIN domain-containing protein [Methanothrix sp.]HPC90361.1 PIN domain-containing protein [Methanothrix sp.]HQI68558.1 PIN domain-containing protein [Methanothrix sp.]HRS85844.1 PIN domain-containing protein [Methanothrix sp.]